MKKIIFIILILPVFTCTLNNANTIEYENPKKALLVIDMQIDYIGENAKFSIEKSQIENLISKINIIMNDYNNDNFQIIYLRNIFRKNDWKNKFRNYASIEGSLGIEIDPRINIVSKNIFDKYTPSAFSNIDFNNYLIQNKINEIYVCGVMADQCVYSTTLDAFNKGYKVNYIANAVGSTSVRNIERAIKKLRNKGIKIIEY